MKVLLACGGTGGHIFPAFSVAEELKRRNPGTQIVYVCGKKDIEDAIFKLVKDEKVLSVESAPFRGGWRFLDPRFLIKLMKGFFRSVALLRREKPDLVVGFGGHFSFPVILTARFMHIKTLVHEQNVVPGLANKVLCRFVEGVAVSFKETARHLPAHKNIRTTGNPIRSAIEKDTREEALRFFGFSGEKITILVLGGSQGAESINTLLLDALKVMPAGLTGRIQVLHLCGRMAPGLAEEAFRRAGVTARVYSFFERMDLAYGACDFAVGRAGATFLAEIASKNIPAILIPYPFGDGHQRANAGIFSRERSAVVVEQKDLTPEKLAGLLADTVRKIEEKRRMGSFNGSAPSSDGAAPPNGWGGPISDPNSNARVLLADFIEEMILK